MFQQPPPDTCVLCLEVAVCRLLIDGSDVLSLCSLAVLLGVVFAHRAGSGVVRHMLLFLLPGPALPWLMSYPICILDVRGFENAVGEGMAGRHFGYATDYQPQSKAHYYQGTKKVCCLQTQADPESGGSSSTTLNIIFLVSDGSLIRFEVSVLCLSGLERSELVLLVTAVLGL